MAPNYKELYEQAEKKQIADGFADLKGDIKKLDDKQDITNRHLEKVNGRLTKVEEKVFPSVPQTVQQLPSIWRNPELLKLAVGIVGFLTLCAVIYAGLKGIKLPGGLP
jgi:hypothetical protein